MKAVSQLLRQGAHLARQTFAHFLPHSCLLCGQSSSGERLCSGCVAQLPFLNRHPHCCHQCALPLNALASTQVVHLMPNASASHISPPPLWCGECLDQPPHFTRAIIPLAYAHPVDHLIDRFKNHRDLAAGHALGDQIILALSDAEHRHGYQLPDIVIPAPMHWRNRWKRGFNQSELLARQIATEFNLRYYEACIQIKEHAPQKLLSREDRERNLRGCFVIGEHARFELQGARVALVDDVVTTGATMRALAHELRKAGAAEVDIWAIARTPKSLAEKTIASPSTEPPQ